MGGVSGCYVNLEFATAANATSTTPVNVVNFIVELMWQTSSSADPSAAAALPVFLTQWNHRAWAASGVQRGYLAVVSGWKKKEKRLFLLLKFWHTKDMANMNAFIGCATARTCNDRDETPERL